MAGFCRDVPDDDLLAVARGQKVFFSFRKARGFRRHPPDRRNRKQHGALRGIKHRKTDEIAAHNESNEPFQDDHLSTIMRDPPWPRWRYIPLTIFSVIFLASPSSIMVLSR
jgi:hypothetical protein